MTIENQSTNEQHQFEGQPIEDQSVRIVAIENQLKNVVANENQSIRIITNKNQPISISNSTIPSNQAAYVSFITDASINNMYDLTKGEPIKDLIIELGNL